MRKTDTKRIGDTLRFIRDYQRDNAKSPTYREIMKACGHQSLGTVKHDVDFLCGNGSLETYEGKGWNKIGLPVNLGQGSVHAVPVVGSVACGKPSPAIEDIESTVMLPDSLFGKGNHFILKAKGRSMVNCGIFPGDLMVVNRDRSAVTDDIVVVMMEGGEATAKILSFSGGRHYLSPGNDETDESGRRLYDDIPLSENSRIIGVVEKVIHTPAKNSYGRL